MKKYSQITLLFLLYLVIPLAAYAQLSLPKVLSDNMVLQQGKKVTIWGSATPRESVIVKFQKQTKRTQADENGNWAVQLDELKSTKVSQQLIVQGKNKKIVLKNILIGEVWLASGQSNMEYSMNKHLHYAKPQRGDKEFLQKSFKAANSPIIRVMYVEKNLKTDTLPSKGWQMLNEESLAPVSAIGYFFAKSLVDNIDVPVGIISTSWGGTPIETWTPPLGERYIKMVEPMAPYSLRGFLWYQGETNLINGDTDAYTAKQNNLVESWRAAWKDDSLSFYYVQLAPYLYSPRRGTLVANTWEALPLFWKAQTACLSMPHTGMVVTTDLVDNLKDIHPSYKWVVGERLARLALAKNYGKTDVICSGPTFNSLSVQGTEIILEFDNVGSGLTTNDGKAPNWFYLKDKKGAFKKANAVIKNNTIVLPKDNNTKEPVEVRFAWDEEAMPNLFNKEGLPTVPFSTAH
ncbi:sialate O-acetylesterase [Bacteroides sp. 214]|uniref:sialate O-acetylesterase n=1 Tax=Bacteroides sp. 214 TaxID=2302935 RepID=UPI0013D504B0|nr:sialate O-acetylesterase [Bacteroides sp. 214]NDW11484.1 sialate O-acetylesterase [Bacteroides sp. 214]